MFRAASLVLVVLAIAHPGSAQAPPAEFDVVSIKRSAPDAVGGTMRGARFRWDLNPDGPQGTVVVWRGNIHIADSSRLLRAMLRIEPSFEHSANVSIGLVSVRSAAAQAMALAKAR